MVERNQRNFPRQERQEAGKMPAVRAVAHDNEVDGRLTERVDVVPHAIHARKKRVRVGNRFGRKHFDPFAQGAKHVTQGERTADGVAVDTLVGKYEDVLRGADELMDSLKHEGVHSNTPSYGYPLATSTAGRYTASVLCILFAWSSRASKPSPKKPSFTFPGRPKERTRSP